MISALYIALENQFAAPSWLMDGRSLARATVALDLLAPSINMPSISDLCTLDWKSADWKSPAEGLRIFEKYLGHVQLHPDSVPDSAAVIVDIKDAIRTIVVGQQRGCKWRLMIDYA